MYRGDYRVIGKDLCVFGWFHLLKRYLRNGVDYNTPFANCSVGGHGMDIQEVPSAYGLPSYSCKECCYGARYLGSKCNYTLIC